MNAQVIERQRYEQAAELLLQVQADGAPPEAFAEMLAWCDADPENKLAMERIEEAWAVSGEVDPAPLQSLAAPPGRTRIDRRWHLGEMLRRFTGPAFVAGVAALAIAMSAFLIGPEALMGNRFGGAGERLATARGVHETAKLPDGSMVDLGAKSALAVVYSPHNRTVFAEDGEAFYRVSKDRSRPFIVRAGAVTVTAVGTAFAVRRAGESVSVIVTEGAVEVRVDQVIEDSQVEVPSNKLMAVRVGAGERVRYDRGELSRSTETVAPEVATGWREGRLQFIDEPLRLVIAAVNRYSERELLISDPSIEELRFTGTVSEKGIDTWLQGVARVFPVRIVEIDRRRVMIAPAVSPRS